MSLLSKLLTLIENIFIYPTLRVWGLSILSILRFFSYKSESTKKYLYDNTLNDIPKKKGIFHPQNKEHIIRLIKVAHSNHATIRVVGSGHSVWEAIYAQNNNCIHIILGGDFKKIHSINISSDGNFALVNVGAGCHLGRDPNDRESSFENSFNFQVDQKGYALPILGGMSHQTIAGFLQTSSSGGSLEHGIADVLEEIEIINGKGETIILNKKTNEDKFNASVVSMGLFGVITRATFNLPKKYSVEGTEINKEFKDSLLVNDKGHYRKLHDALKNNEYFHMNWFPQKYVQRTSQWNGNLVSPELPKKPYKHLLKEKFMNVLAALALRISNLTEIIIGGNLAQRIIGLVLRTFIRIRKPVHFRDLWYKVLPNDDQADVDRLMKTSYTEIWFPLEKIDEVMGTLERLFRRKPSYAGTFAIELYGAKNSPYWMSPSYKRDVFRVNPYWWGRNLGDPYEFFEEFWKVLLPIDGARLHWGKYMPKPGEIYGEHIFGINYLRHCYPKLNNWLDIREEMDPDQIFVTNYWRRMFDIRKNI
ncbi:FAD-binding domain-containing protein [Gigaspora margarita]|uniref:D-arabinono-1,4-lactone oxidase n=1 Tax=Gigaspora margarita TaxID=4874 RepID=A0A8H4EMG1_GIGMA|nr:FAD-binding domain-containing protein [Gigaspora margarita]